MSLETAFKKLPGQGQLLNSPGTHTAALVRGGDQSHTFLKFKLGKQFLCSSFQSKIDSDANLNISLAHTMAPKADFVKNRM